MMARVWDTSVGGGHLDSPCVDKRCHMIKYCPVIGQEIIHVRLSVRFIAFCAQTVNTCRQVSILSIDGNSNNKTLRVKG